MNDINQYGNKEWMYVGKLERVLFIKVVRPPFDKYSFFQSANFLFIFSSIGPIFLWTYTQPPREAPNISRAMQIFCSPKSQPKPIFLAPIGTNLLGLIFVPSTASKHRKMHFKQAICTDISIKKSKRLMHTKDL